MDPCASPAQLSDTALDELDLDAGIFTSKEIHPREIYYQTRLARSMANRMSITLACDHYLIINSDNKVQMNSLAGSPQLAALDVENETYRNVEDKSSVEKRASSSSTEGADPSSVTGAGSSDLPVDIATPRIFEEALRSPSMGDIPIQTQTSSEDMKSRTPSDLNHEMTPNLEVHVAEPTRDQTPRLPEKSPRRPSTPPVASSSKAPLDTIPSPDLISFDSQRPLENPLPQTPSLKIRQRSVDFLFETPAAYDRRMSTFPNAPTPLVLSEILESPRIFSPSTTASFVITEPLAPLNKVLLQTKDPDQPTTPRKDSISYERRSEEPEPRSMKKAKLDSVTPGRAPVPLALRLAISSARRTPQSTLSSSTQRVVQIPRSAARRASATPSRNAAKLPSSFIPQESSDGAAGAVDLPESTSLMQSVRMSSEPPPASAPFEFEFSFSSSIPIPPSPKRTPGRQPDEDYIPVVLDGLKFAPPSTTPIRATPKAPKGSAARLTAAEKGKEKEKASPIRFNLNLISPKKHFGSASAASKSTLERPIWGSPVRPSTKPTAVTQGAPPPRPAASVNVRRDLPKPRVVPTNANLSSSSPAKAPVVPSSSPIKRPVKTGLPVPKSSKMLASKLPRPGSSHASVNAVQAQQASRSGSPSLASLRVATRDAPSKTAPKSLPTLPSKRFRQVVPGTLTGWEGRPPSSASTREASGEPDESSPAETHNTALPTAQGSPHTDVVAAPQARRLVRYNDTHPEPTSSADASPRRSRRLSSEASPENDNGTREREANRIARPVARKAKASLAAGAARPMTEKAFKELTKANTTRNGAYFVEIDRRVVRRDCPRPPSPSSKVRAALSEDDKEKEEGKVGRAERAKKRGLLEDEMDFDEDTRDVPAKHFRAAGDDEDFETPKKRRIDYIDGSGGQPFAALQLESPKPMRNPPSSAEMPPSSHTGDKERYVKPNSKGLILRWHKKLVFNCEQGEKVDYSSDAGRGILVKDAVASRLDPVGNVPETSQQLEGLQKDSVVVIKYVYADDPDPSQVEVEIVTPAEPQTKKGKRKRN